ncbi:MAG: D-glycero-beta-D-manno-heptose-7-phosphate kinase [Candidatus Binatia bacterium]
MKKSIISRRKLLALVSRFRRSRLLVVGDLMLDRFIWGEVERISPEAPVPVVRVTSEGLRLGGAANVIHNIRSLGGHVTACGVLGKDEPGKQLLRSLKKIGISTAGVFSESNFQTTQKSRVIAHPRHQQLVRMDHENHGEIGEGVRERIRQFVEREASRYDGVVLSDYGKGIVHPELLRLISRLALKKGILCVVDPKKENYRKYRDVSLVTPNKEEASEASGIEIRDQASLQKVGKALLKMWQAKSVLITRGQEGMSLFSQDGTSGYYPTAARDIFDVTGAGDTVVATCALVLASRGTVEEAAVMANLAAGVVVGEVGTAAVPVDRLKQAILDSGGLRSGIEPGRRSQ